MEEYIYFEDKFTSQVAGAAFGLLGALASTKHIGIVLDTKTGMAMQLDDKTMQTLLKDHPDLLTKFEKSNKKRATKKVFVKALNKLLAAEKP